MLPDCKVATDFITLLSLRRKEYHKYGANLSLVEPLDCKDATIESQLYSLNATLETSEYENHIQNIQRVQGLLGVM